MQRRPNRRRNQNANPVMNQQQFQNVLTAVLGAGNGGLDLGTLGQNLQAAVTAIQNQNQNQPAQARELSLVKVAEFSGNEEEDPYEWTDQFTQAAAANRWTGDDRLLAIAKGYLKGAASDWAQAVTAQAANPRVTTWDNGNANTSFVPRFIDKFAPVTKQTKWHHELMNMRQRANESVDAYSLRFQRLLRKVNVNQAIPDVFQVRMYLFGLTPLITPLVSTSNPANLAIAIDRAREVETGYHYVPSRESLNDSKSDEVDDLTKKIEQLTLNYATLASALTVQPVNQQRRPFRQVQSTPPQRQAEDRTCYNCNKTGHIARNCRLPKRSSRRTRFNNTRDVHYADYQDEEEYYDNEYSGYDEEEEEYELYRTEREVYPVTRSGRPYEQRRDNNSFKSRPIVDELDARQQNRDRRSTSPLETRPDR